MLVPKSRHIILQMSQTTTNQLGLTNYIIYHAVFLCASVNSVESGNVLK